MGLYKNNLTKEQLAKVVSLGKNGMARKNIAKTLCAEFKKPMGTLYAILSEMSPDYFPETNTARTKVDREKIEQAYQRRLAGDTVRKIARENNLGVTTLGSALGTWRPMRQKIMTEIANGGLPERVMVKYRLSPNLYATLAGIVARAGKLKSLDRSDIKLRKNDGKKALELIKATQRGMRELDTAVYDTSVIIPETLPYIGLWCAGDWHIESEWTNLDALHDHLRLVAKTPGMYVSFCGDAMDNAIPGGPHPDILNDRTIPVRHARLAVGELFRTIKDKLICVTTGCHIQWSITVDDYNLYEDLTREMGVKYLGPGGTVNLSFPGGGHYRGRFMHKYTGSAGQNKLNCCQQYLMKEDASCDFVVVAHNHVSWGATGDWQGKTRAFIRSGSYKSMDTFARRIQVRGQEQAHNPVLILGTKERYMSYEPSVEIAIQRLKEMNRK